MYIYIHTHINNQQKNQSHLDISIHTYIHTSTGSYLEIRIQSQTERPLKALHTQGIFDHLVVGTVTKPYLHHRDRLFIYIITHAYVCACLCAHMYVSCSWPLCHGYRDRTIPVPQRQVIYIYIYIYIYHHRTISVPQRQVIYIHTYIHIYIYLYIPSQNHICTQGQVMYIYIYIYILSYMLIYVCIHVYKLFLTSLLCHHRDRLYVLPSRFCVCAHACIHIHACILTGVDSALSERGRGSLHVCVYVYVCVYICVCMYIYVCMYVYIYTYIYIYLYKKERESCRGSLHIYV